jgi:hypothetical protein
MSQNTVFKNRPHLGGGAQGDCLGFQYGPKYLWFIFNHCYDVGVGIRQSDTNAKSWGHPVYVIGNVIHDLYQKPNDTKTFWGRPQTGAAMLFYGGQHAWYIIDNTLYNFHNGINVIFDGARVEIHGNVMFNKLPPVPGAQDGRQIDVDWPAKPANSHATADYNLVFGGNSVQIAWGSGNRTSHTSVAAFAAATRQCAHCIQRDPLFLNVGGKDVELSAASPARRSSVKHSAYATFQSLYGIDISKAPHGASDAMESWDMGVAGYWRSRFDRSSLPQPPTRLQRR